MAALAELISSHDEALQTEISKKLWLDQIPTSSEKDSPDEVRIDYEIQATLSQLKELKFQNIGLRTKELFLQRILEAKSVEDTFPSPQEAARLELRLGREKTKLRSIKAARAAAEKRLDEAVVDTGKVLAERDTARAEVEKTLADVKAQSRLDIVKAALSTGRVEDLEKVVNDVEQLDATCCECVAEELNRQTSELEEESARQAGRAQEIQARKESLEKEIAAMESRTEKLKAQISSKDEKDENAEKLRREWKVQEELGHLLSTLLGIRIASERDNGMTLEINDSVFAKPSRGVAMPRSATHKLDIEFNSNTMGETIVSHMHLTPADVDISDIDTDMNLSLQKAVQLLFSRLMGMKEEQMDCQ